MAGDQQCCFQVAHQIAIVFKEHMVYACRVQIPVQGGDPRQGIVKLMQAIIACPSIQDTASEMADTFTEQIGVASGNSSNPSTALDLTLR